MVVSIRERHYTGVEELSQQLRAQGHENWALALEGCGTEVRRIVCEVCGWSHTVKAHCKLKACPSCQSLRAFRIKKRYLRPISRFREPKLLTLTIRSTKQLGAGVKKIRKAFEKFRRRKAVRRWIRAGIYAIEANPQPNGHWNVHLHALIDAPFRPQPWVSQMWEQATGGDYVVDIRRIPAKQGLKYLLEYLAKGPANEKKPWPIEAIIKYLKTLENVRLVQVFGWLLGAAERGEAFVCPECGESIWRVECLITGRVLFSELGWIRSQDGWP